MSDDRPRWVWKLATGGDVPVPWPTAHELYEEALGAQEIRRVADVELPFQPFGENDKLIVGEDGLCQLAERFRKPTPGHGVDFTIEGGLRDALLAAQETPWIGPALLAFGIAKSHEAPGRRGFASFFLLDAQAVARRLIATEHEEGPFESYADVEFYVYPWEEIHETGAIWRSWEIKDLQTGGSMSSSEESGDEFNQGEWPADATATDGGMPDA